jgi:hypothetical protein
MSLLAYYKFDNDYKDYSGNGYNGTNNGVDLISGKINNSADFEDTESDYISIGNISNLNFDGSLPFSISFWINLESSVADMSILSKRNHVSPFEGWEVLVTSANKIRFNIGSNNTTDKLEVETTNTITDSIWTHIIITYDGSQLPSGVNIYINNIVESSLTTIQNNFTGNSSNSYNVSIGSRNNTTTFFDGLLDEVRIYDSILTPLERDRIINYLGRKEIVINNKDYSEILVNMSMKETFGKVGRYEFKLLDSTIINTSSISYGQTVDIYVSGILKFKGIIFDKPLEQKTGFIHFLVYSKVIYLLDKFININYTNRTIDYIIKDIIDIYFSGVFTYNGVGARTIIYDNIVYNGQSVWFIFQDLVKRENLQLRINVYDDIIMEDLLTNDSGKSYNLDSGFSTKTFNFPDISQTIKNSILVYSKQLTPDGKGGKAVRYNNLDSISLYGRKIEHSPFTDNALETEDECLAKGKEIIDEIAFVLQDGDLDIFFDADLLPGQLIRITYTKKNFIDKQFLIKSVDHKIRPQHTIIKIAEVNNTTLDLLVSVFNALRKNEERFRDSTATIANIIQLFEKININMRVTITRIIAGSRRYNVDTKMNSFSMVAGTETEQIVVSDERMVLTNDGKKKLLDILTDVSGIRLTTANLWGGLGTGTTPALITDTNLETPIDIDPADGTTEYQGMDGGFPSRVDDYNLEMQYSVTDADLSSQLFNEVGLFDAKSSGKMYSRQVTSTPFNKNPNETLRVKIVMEMVDL